MRDPVCVIAYDIGTTSAKTCLYRFEDKGIRLLASFSAEYPLHFLAGGGIEQNPDDWWQAMCITTSRVIDQSGIKPSAVAGIAFCCQMQGLVLVDTGGNALRPAFSYMDQRAVCEKEKGISHGIKIAGLNLFKLIPSLVLTGGVSASVKDPVWKYHWVKTHEPDIFKKTAKWLDIKEYLISRAVGRFVMTPDSANATFLYDNRPGHEGWSRQLCRMFAVHPEHLPEVIRPDDVAGPLLAARAIELGLTPGIQVFGGGGDLSMIALGSGAVNLHDTHIYTGTSGWVSAVTDRRVVDTDAFIASILGVREGYYNYISEQETAGKCMEWVKNHLALDEIGIFLSQKTVVDDPDKRYASLFDYLNETIDSVTPGSGGVIFTPWLHGNRSPFEDPNARGMFFNIGLDTGKRALIRSVAEGIGFHNRWQLESIRKKVKTASPLRFVGGGARSASIAQIMADILGEPIETIDQPQNAGALGAALVCAKGLGVISGYDEAKRFVQVNALYRPRPENREIYERHFQVFQSLYRQNKQNFRILNS